MFKQILQQILQPLLTQLLQQFLKNLGSNGGLVIPPIVLPSGVQATLHDPNDPHVKAAVEKTVNDLLA